MPSIQARLATGLLISLVVLLIAQWIVVERSIGKLSEQFIISRMLHSNDLLVAAITISGESIALDQSRVDPVYNKPFSGFYYSIKYAQQEFRSRSLWDESLPFKPVALGETYSARRDGPQSQQLLLLVNAYKKKNAIIQIAVAEDITDINRNISGLLKLHAVLSLFILVVLIVLQVVIIRRSLLPLEKTRRELVELENGLIQKLDENVPREIISLVQEINLRIAAFQQRIERSRRATGNLAHALKRPLTLISQLGQDNDVLADPQLAQNLRDYSEEIQRIINRELSRARMAGTSIGATRTEIGVETQALIATLQAMYRDKNLTIDLDAAEPCHVSIEREDFHELMGNLLDNACKWAKHTIKVSVQCDNGVLMRIEDDGPGIPEERRDEIMQRGKRLDEQVDGHGLGMSIVKDIVEQYQAGIFMQQSETLGGLSVTVRWC